MLGLGVECVDVGSVESVSARWNGQLSSRPLRHDCGTRVVATDRLISSFVWDARYKVMSDDGRESNDTAADRQAISHEPSNPPTTCCTHAAARHHARTQLHSHRLQHHTTTLPGHTYRLQHRPPVPQHKQTAVQPHSHTHINYTSHSHDTQQPAHTTTPRSNNVNIAVQQPCNRAHRQRKGRPPPRPLRHTRTVQWLC